LKITSGIGSFTPAAADARRAMSFGRAGFADSGFHFTPSIAPGSRRNVTVAIRARAFNASRAGQPATLAAVTPSAYNLGVAFGWKRFALTGAVARVDGGLLPLGREAADVGLSYSGNKWSTRLQLGAERAVGTATRLISADESYSVDLGGSYSLTRNLEVTGGVRYKMQRDRLERLTDERQDSQAVYVGTAFKF
jgi:predicted porin